MGFSDSLPLSHLLLHLFFSVAHRAHNNPFTIAAYCFNGRRKDVCACARFITMKFVELGELTKVKFICYFYAVGFNIKA